MLVGGLEHVLFSHILGIVIPTDLYFSEGLKPPTRMHSAKGNGLDFGDSCETDKGMTNLCLGFPNILMCWCVIYRTKN